MRGRRRPVEGGEGGSETIPTLHPVMAGPVPATHAVRSRARAPDGPGPARDPAMARTGVGARDEPGHDGERGRRKTGEGAGEGSETIPTLHPVMAGPVPATHAVQSRARAPDGPVPARDPAVARPGVGARDEPRQDGGGAEESGRGRA